MAATEASTEPVQAEAGEAKAEEEPANAESAPAPTEETQPTTEAAQSTEKPTDKVKPASETIWGSFLNKSGLGKVMGGKKKKEHSTTAEDAVAEGPDKTSATNEKDQEESADLKDQPTGEEAKTGEDVTDGQVIEKAEVIEEATPEQRASGTKPKQGEKSTVRDFIRNPVAKIFSHRSTDKKESSGEVSKHGKIRSKSLDRMEDADASTVAVDQCEDSQAPEETDKSTAQTTKHVKRWHSFKKLMAQKSHKKNTDESKDVEGAEGGSADAPGDTGTLDSSTKSEHTGQKRWKLKRSWTFQGLKRDPSIVGIHKPKDKDSSDNLKDENAPEADQEGTQASEDFKLSVDGETQENHPEGEEEKEATATTTRAKHVDQHANEIWTSFKKRVIPKSKKAADAGGGEEEQTGEPEQNEESQASKDSSKTAKSKRTHFNRAVSLKNFILRKGKNTSMDMGEGSAVEKENDGEPKEMDTDTAGASDLPQGEPENQATTQSESNNESQVADEHKSPDGEEKSLPSIPSGQQSDTPLSSSEGGGQEEPTVEPKTNGENGCSDAAEEDTTATNHEPSTQNGVEKEGQTSQENIDCTAKTCPMEGKLLNQDGKCDTENAVAQSGEFEAAVDSNDKTQPGKPEPIVGLGASVELETGVCSIPDNGGFFSGSTINNDEPDVQEETLKRMFYEAATSIVQTVLMAATDQLVNEKDFLDSSHKCSHTENNGNYSDVDIGYCH